MSPGFDLGDYNTVVERLEDFRLLYPEGSLQSEIATVPPPFAGSFIAVKASAYRSPGDRRPGVGLAWEPMPGKTSFTRDSELQNAETAAWGRAIVAVLASDTKKGIASREEVAPRRADQGEDQRRAIFARLKEVGITDRKTRLDWASDVLGRMVTTFTTLTRPDFVTLLEWFNTDLARDAGESTERALGTHSTDPGAEAVSAPVGAPTPQGRGGAAELNMPTGSPPLVHPSPSFSADRSTELRFAIAAAHAKWARTMPKGAEAWMKGYLAHVGKQSLEQCGLAELEAGWDWLVALHRDV